MVTFVLWLTYRATIDIVIFQSWPLESVKTHGEEKELESINDAWQARRLNKNKLDQLATTLLSSYR